MKTIFYGNAYLQGDRSEELNCLVGGFALL